MMDTEAFERLAARVVPEGRIIDVKVFGVDAADEDEGTAKGTGYGQPVLLRVEDAAGTVHSLVFHTAKSDAFGHDRRADRAAEMLLAFDDFRKIPGHTPALDVGAVTRDDGLVSLSDAGEFYLVTRFAEGHVYADDLREIARVGELRERDVARADALVHQLIAIHAEKSADATRYRRAIRDLVGGGEGVFGMIDSYASDVPSAAPERLRALEQQLLDWRWKLKNREHRSSRTHGDFHPFNVVFSDDDVPTLLDASRGCVGDPADDVACMAINYVFFAVEHPSSWQRGFSRLWYRFWDSYLEHSKDAELLGVCAPFLAWRGLVIANPAWYPHVTGAVRDRLLSFIENALSSERFDPASAEAVFA
jgi:hypothetical protein